MDAVEGWLVSDGDFFAPVPFDLFDNLMSQYAAVRTRLEAMAEAVSAPNCQGVLHYFVEANVPEGRHSAPTQVSHLFDLQPAIAQLDADFWDRALKMTDVLDYMPQKRRTDWYEQIQNPTGKKRQHRGRGDSEWEVEPIPAFTAETVRATIESLLGMRYKFFGERIDGIFKSLSRSHVTNSPKGFRQRMIINRALSSYGTVEYNTAGVINDLRCVIAKFMGRDEPGHNATDDVIKLGKKRTGQWVSIDGGALRIRVYAGVGTAHLEVHEEIAWRLNCVLASLYPLAIPAEFRERPKRAKRVKEFNLFSRPIPFAVLSVLAGMKPTHRKEGKDRHFNDRYVEVPMTREFPYREIDKAAKAQAITVLEAIGGVKAKDGNLAYWAFDYDPTDVLDDIICSGQIPDQRSHQFYPTPESVALQAISLAEEGATDSMLWLEPSAGIGNLADRMPRGRTTCIEISELHAGILRTKGHDVVCADFLAAPANQAYGRIVMNPPFSEGRWQAHLEHASKMLAPSGRLVAILPASARGKALLPGFNAVWSDVLENAFDGTTVAVVIGRFERS